MPDTKITALAAITTVAPANDLFAIVDVSDNSMAASGTTKNITTNQILGAGGTATLASATISGDLTVDTSTLKVDSANKRVGVGTASPATRFHVALAAATYGEVARFYDSSGNGISLTANASSGFNQFTSTGAQPLIFNVNSGERYRLGSDGTATWSVAGSTAMTLNSTGLGIGGSPTTGFLTVGSISNVSATTNALTILSQRANFSITSNGATDAAGTTINYSWAVTGGQGPLIFRNAAIANVMTLDASGNVGVGVASPSSRLEAQEAGTGSGLGGIISSTATAGGNAGYVFRTGGTNRWSVSLTGSAGAESIRFYDVNAAATRMTLDASGNLILQSSATPATLSTNGQLTVNATSNTNLRFSYRGSDGVTRVANITLA